MPGLRAAVADPRFSELPPDAQRELAAQYDPRMADLPEVAQDSILTRLAPDPYEFNEKRQGLPPNSLKALQEQENQGLDPNATSSTGVRGLMQITGATAQQYGLPEELHMDPAAQITTAARILGHHYSASGDLAKAYAKYGDPNQKGYADEVMKRYTRMGGAPASGEEMGPPFPGYGGIGDALAGWRGNPLAAAAGAAPEKRPFIPEPGIVGGAEELLHGASEMAPTIGASVVGGKVGQALGAPLGAPGQFGGSLLGGAAGFAAPAAVQEYRRQQDAGEPTDWTKVAKAAGPDAATGLATMLAGGGMEKALTGAAVRERMGEFGTGIVQRLMAAAGRRIVPREAATAAAEAAAATTTSEAARAAQTGEAPDPHAAAKRALQNLAAFGAFRAVGAPFRADPVAEGVARAQTAGTAAPEPVPEGPTTMGEAPPPEPAGPTEAGQAPPPPGEPAFTPDEEDEARFQAARNITPRREVTGGPVVRALPPPTPGEPTVPVETPPAPGGGQMVEPAPAGPAAPSAGQGEALPEELQAVFQGQARAYLHPPEEEGTVPTPGERALAGQDLKGLAAGQDAGYYRGKDGSQVVYDPQQVTEKALQDLDAQGKLPEVVNGPGTAPKPDAPTTAVTVRTPSGAEARTVLTDSPEATDAAIAAQPPGHTTEVRPADQAVPALLAARQAADPTQQAMGRLRAAVGAPQGEGFDVPPPIPPETTGPGRVAQGFDPSDPLGSTRYLLRNFSFEEAPMLTRAERTALEQTPGGQDQIAAYERNMHRMNNLNKAFAVFDDVGELLPEKAPQYRAALKVLEGSLRESGAQEGAEQTKVPTGVVKGFHDLLTRYERDLSAKEGGEPFATEAAGQTQKVAKPPSGPTRAQKIALAQLADADRAATQGVNKAGEPLSRNLQESARGEAQRLRARLQEAGVTPPPPPEPAEAPEGLAGAVARLRGRVQDVRDLERPAPLPKELDPDLRRQQQAMQEARDAAATRRTRADLTPEQVTEAQGALDRLQGTLREKPPISPPALDRLVRQIDQARLAVGLPPSDEGRNLLAAARLRTRVGGVRGDAPEGGFATDPEVRQAEVNVAEAMKRMRAAPEGSKDEPVLKQRWRSAVDALQALKDRNAELEQPETPDWLREAGKEGPAPGGEPGERGSFSLKPKKPPPDYTLKNEELNNVLAKTKTPDIPWHERAMWPIEKVKEEFTNFEYLLKDDPLVKEMVRRTLTNAYPREVQRAAQKVSTYLGNMQKSEGDPFANLVLLNDAIARREKGLAENLAGNPDRNGNPTTEPTNAEPNDMFVKVPTDELRANRDDLLRRVPQEVRDAIDRREKVWQAVGEELVRRGEMNPEDLKEHYFPHVVQDYIRAKSLAGGMPGALREPATPWTKHAEGSVRAIAKDVIAVDTKRLTQIGVAHTIDDFMDKVLPMRDVLHTMPEDQRAALFGRKPDGTPDGPKAHRVEFTVDGKPYQAYQYRRGFQYFPPETETEYIATAPFDREHEPFYLIPKNLAERLDQGIHGPEQSQLMRAVGHYVSGQKSGVLALLGLRYREKHLFGELFEMALNSPTDALSVFNPSYAREAMAQLRGGKGAKYPALQQLIQDSDMLRSSFIGAMSGVGPVPDAITRFSDRNAILRAKDAVMGPVQRAIQTTEMYPHMIQAIRDYERLITGQPITSRLVDLRDLPDDMKLGKKGREQTIDYSAIGGRYYNSAVRKYLAPWSAWYMWSASRMGYYLRHAPINLLTKFGMLYGLTYLWNNKVTPDVERHLQAMGHLSGILHINMPFKSTAGEDLTVSLHVQSDVLPQLIGADQIMPAAGAYGRGEITKEQALHQVLQHMKGHDDLTRFPESDWLLRQVPLAKMFASLWANRDATTGIPIVPEKLKGTDKALQLQSYYVYQTIAPVLGVYDAAVQRAQGMETGVPSLPTTISRAWRGDIPVGKALKDIGWRLLSTVESGPGSLEGAIQLHRIDPALAEIQQLRHEAEALQGPKNQTMMDLENAYVESKTLGKPEVFEQARQEAMQRIRTGQAPQLGQKDWENRRASPDVQMRVAQSQLENADTDAQRHQFHEMARFWRAKQAFDALKREPKALRGSAYMQNPEETRKRMANLIRTMAKTYKDAGPERPIADDTTEGGDE